MHLPERKCDLPLNSLTALSHGKNRGVQLPLLSVAARTFFLSHGEIILAILENPLQVGQDIEWSGGLIEPSLT